MLLTLNLMAVIKIYDVYKPSSLSTNLDPRRGKERKPGFEVSDSFTGFSSPFSKEEEEGS